SETDMRQRDSPSHGREGTTIPAAELTVATNQECAMLTRTIVLAVVFVVSASLPASARWHHHRHHHHYAHHHHHHYAFWRPHRGLWSRQVYWPRPGGAPVSWSARGGDRAPITGGGY